MSILPSRSRSSHLARRRTTRWVSRRAYGPNGHFSLMEALGVPELRPCSESLARMASMSSSTGAPFSSSADQPARARFATTRWSMVVSAGGRQDSPEARDALTVLCQAYWYPLYAYLRRQGTTANDARDLVQGFFAELLE